MIKILYGQEKYLIEKEIKAIKKENHIDSLNITTYDLELVSLKQIIEDANSISLFTSTKMIIVENSYIFTGTIPKKVVEQDISLLESYIENPNDTILIFIVNKEKLDERKKIVKLAKKKNLLFEYNKVSNLTKFIADELKDYQISSSDISLFIDRVGEDLGTIEQEIQKIKLYKEDEKQITHQDILNLTSKTINTNIFLLIENIVLNKKEEAISSYREMVKLGQEPIMILIMLVNQFRLIYQSKKLYQKGYSKRDIASLLKAHPYAVEKALEKGRDFTDSLLLKFIYDLANLDIQIKSGQIDKDIAIEMFILDK